MKTPTQICSIVPHTVRPGSNCCYLKSSQIWIPVPRGWLLLPLSHCCQADQGHHCCKHQKAVNLLWCTRHCINPDTKGGKGGSREPVRQRGQRDQQALPSSIWHGYFRHAELSKAQEKPEEEPPDFRHQGKKGRPRSCSRMPRWDQYQGADLKMPQHWFWSICSRGTPGWRGRGRRYCCWIGRLKCGNFSVWSKEWQCKRNVCRVTCYISLTLY